MLIFFVIRMVRFPTTIALLIAMLTRLATALLPCRNLLIRNLNSKGISGHSRLFAKSADVDTGKAKKSISKSSNNDDNDEVVNKGPQIASESVVITPRKVDYSAWYTDVIAAADMIDASPVRGCMVIKPWGMGVWDLLRAEFDERIRESGTQNAYFPLLIPKSFLAKEVLLHRLSSFTIITNCSYEHIYTGRAC